MDLFLLNQIVESQDQIISSYEQEYVEKHKAAGFQDGDRT
jgi:hypothetical protein